MNGETKALSDGQGAATGGARRWAFANAVLDERTLELHVGSEIFEVERKPLEVLMHLLKHAGDVVTKDELLEAVWPGRILSETVLTKCIGRIREVLGDAEQTIIKTVYGYGYRFIAPVQVEVSRAAQPARLNFRQGDHPPLRSLWSLVQRLGTGGHGEAWLVRHDKTRELRVFKFALDESSLSALKREITLFRLLRDALGDKARIVTLLDWNLEQAPYFIEAEYIVGGSLTDWAAARGGAASIPLAERIELVAQVAEALATVHSVGVLHKDLKPSNVLIDATPGQPPSIRLGDLGSGGLLDMRRLEAMGITRLGFTQTVAALTTTSGTPLYFAPELIAGQPPTVQADIYALGVVLYQMVVGDLYRPLSPGWERDIQDELLREDIAAAAEGTPELRLANAGELVRRLRSLAERRCERESERQATKKAEAAKLAAERMRARKAALTFAWVATALGFVISTWLFFDAIGARKKAESEAARARAVSEFLSQGMLATINSGKRSVKNLTVKELLDSAASEVGKRFSAQPETAAQIHQSLGASYIALEAAGPAEVELEKALDLYEQLEGPGSEQTVRLATQLVAMKFPVSKLPQSIERYDDIRKAALEKLGRTNPSLAALRLELAWGWYKLGQWPRSLEAFRSLAADAPTLEVRGDPILGQVEAGFGGILFDLGDFSSAKTHLTRARAQMMTALGADHAEVARVHLHLGRLATETGDFPAAEAELAAGLKIAEAWGGTTSGLVITARLYIGRLRMAQQKYDQAISILTAVLEENPLQYGEMDQLSPTRRSLAQAHQRNGSFDKALPMMQQALDTSSASYGPDHLLTRRVRVALADLLREMNRLEPAWQVLDARGPFDFDDLAHGHPDNAELLRVKGLLWMASGNRDRARAAFTEALQTTSKTYGPGHAKSRFLSHELERL